MPGQPMENALSERSESKDRQQVDRLHTLTTITTENSSVRGDVREAIRGEAARLGTVGRADERPPLGAGRVALVARWPAG